MTGKPSIKIGHVLARALRIDLGSESYSVTGDGRHAYVEPDPTTGEWIKSHTPTTKQVGRYFYNIFPFIHWIGYYNLQWFIGDLIAGKSNERSQKSQIIKAN